MSDPLTAIANTAIAASPVGRIFDLITAGEFALQTAAEVADLIGRLGDHQRTLEQKEADRRAASADLDGAPAPSGE